MFLAHLPHSKAKNHYLLLVFACVSKKNKEKNPFNSSSIHIFFFQFAKISIFVLPLYSPIMYNFEDTSLKTTIILSFIFRFNYALRIIAAMCKHFFAISALFQPVEFSDIQGAS